MYDGVFFHRYLGCQGIQRGVRLEKLIVVVVFKSLRGSDLPSLFVFVCLAGAHDILRQWCFSFVVWF